MRESYASLLRPEPAPTLPPFDRLAPPPPLNLLAAQVEALTSAGDIVVDLHGRGGWVSRAAMQRLRRGWAFESNRLTRLLAEVVLRPPDLRHLDATVQSLAAAVWQERPLKQSIAALYGSRCATCGRAVTVDEYIWDSDAGAPVRKTYRCAYCRDQLGGGEVRHADTDADDVRRGAEAPEEHAMAVAELRARFPVLAERADLADQLLSLYTPRSLVALHAILQRIEGELRASSVEAALRLAFLHALLPASRLNGYPGRMAGLRIVGGRVRPPSSRQWRERHPWLLFEEGLRLVRGFAQRLEVQPGDVQARLGDHPMALSDGSANVVLRTEALDPRRPIDVPAAGGTAARVRLVLTQPPLRWGVEALSQAYLETALVLGRDAAAELPVGALLGGAVPRLPWSATATQLRRSLAAVRPVLAPDGHVVVVLDQGGPEGIVASALAGVGAGFHLLDVQLSEAEEGVAGTMMFGGPGVPRPPVPRTRANVPLPRLGGEAPDERRFDLSEVERDVEELAVELLRERGEPARFERLLGRILVGLDGQGHLRRLVGTRTFGAAAASEAGEAAGPSSGEEPQGDRDATGPAAGPRGLSFRAREAVPSETSDASWFGGVTRRRPAAERSDEPGADQVELLLDLIVGELRRAGRRRIVEVEPGQWWLAAPQEIARAAIPLSDRVEWAVFSLLTTSGRLTEATLYDRVASMFRGSDAPDAALVQACLDSYRGLSSTPDQLRTTDELQARYAQHTAIVADLVEYGHRLGVRVWVKRSEQAREVGARPLSERLDEREQRAYLPLILRAPAEALEEVDAMWYVRGRLTMLFEVEWTAMLGEPVLRRGAQIPQSEGLVRFLVVVPERTDLVRFKLARSAALRDAMERGNWHILKSNHLRRLVEEDGADLSRLEPLIGLDPAIETAGTQLPLFVPTDAPARRTPA